MPVVFEEPEPDLGPQPRRTPRGVPVAAGLAAAVVIGVLVARGGAEDRPAATRTSVPSQVPSQTPSPPGPSGPTATSAPVSDPIVVASYELPGVLTLTGPPGWRPDPAGSSADMRRFTTGEASGTPGPTVTFGVASRTPLATLEAESERYVGQLVAGGAGRPAVVFSALADTMAVDLTYADAGGRHTRERIWLHDGVRLFVRVGDDPADPVAVDRLFEQSVVSSRPTTP